MKRCPFCNSKAKLQTRDEYIETEFYDIVNSYFTVVCCNDNCGCQTKEFKRADVALATWEKRYRRK